MKHRSFPDIIPQGNRVPRRLMVLMQWVFLLYFLIPYVCGVTITSTSQLKTLTFDYIIVGGGTAGLTLANRLTQNSSITVLVVEAGNTDAGLVNVQAPFLATTLTPNTVNDWNYSVVAQAGLNNRAFPYPRGRILGGCSSVNFMFHQYGSSDDWDKIGNLTGDPEWLWENMKQFVTIHEKVVAPADGHNTGDQFTPAAHGTTGMLPISLPGFNQTIDSRILNTTRQLTEFPYNPDVGGGNSQLLGVGFLQSAIGGGVRSSSSSTYLQNATSRPNLTVLINTTVMRLVQTTAVNPSLKAFRSVQMTPSLADVAVPAGNVPVAVSSITTVTAVKSVILSAGAVGTPKILLLSGIGNSADLAGVGVTTIINNPNVGRNLADHLFLANVYSVTANTTLDAVLRSPSQLASDLTTWQTSKTGMITSTLANNLGFFRLPSTNAIFETVPDPSAGPASPHWEIIFSNFWFNPGVAQPATGNFMTIPVALVSPLSRGSVKLRSNNVFDHPVIDPQFLTNPFDVAAMREAVLAVQRFTAAPAWSGYITGPFGAAFTAAKSTNTSAIDAYVQSFATGIFHPMGTTAMALAADNSTGVVQSDLTVKGTEGVRVVDASVFPFPLSTHPQGAIYLLAERAAVVIMQSKT